MSVATKLGVSEVGEGDAHYPKIVGDAYTIVEVDNPGVNDVVESVRSGRVRFDGRLSAL